MQSVVEALLRAVSRVLLLVILKSRRRNSRNIFGKTDRKVVWRL